MLLEPLSGDFLGVARARDFNRIALHVNGLQKGEIPFQAFLIGQTLLVEHEMAVLDAVTHGLAEPGKAMVPDQNNDMAGLRHFDITGTATVGGDANVGGNASVDGNGNIVGNLDVGGELDVDGAGSIGGALSVGDAATISEALTIGGPFTIGATELTEAELGVLDDVTPGTAAANKALVLDVNLDIEGINNIDANSANLATLEVDDVTASTTISAPLVQAGSSGEAGTLELFPATEDRGSTQITAQDNTGDTTTTIEIAAQAAARNYTVPDAGHDARFVMAETSAMGQTMRIPLLQARNNDYSVIGATGGPADWHYVGAPGTATRLITEEVQNEGDTALVLFEVVLPASYITGQNFDLVANVQRVVDGGGTLTVSIGAEVWKIGDDGLAGADLVQTLAIPINDDQATDTTFEIDGSGLAAGDRLLVRITGSVEEEDDTGTVALRLNSLRVE